MEAYSEEHLIIMRRKAKVNTKAAICITKDFSFTINSTASVNKKEKTTNSKVISMKETDPMENSYGK